MPLHFKEIHLNLRLLLFFFLLFAFFELFAIGSLRLNLSPAGSYLSTGSGLVMLLSSLKNKDLKVEKEKLFVALLSSTGEIVRGFLLSSSDRASVWRKLRVCQQSRSADS